MAIHAFHCTDPACKMPQCADAKLILLKIQTHAQQRYCAVRELLGINVECKVCKLWWVLLSHQRERAAADSRGATAGATADSAGATPSTWT
eukprot:scaffold6406_cov78-Phaeocystis_antarctica.AAC.1